VGGKVSIRKKMPVRKVGIADKNYAGFKVDLRTNFAARCGYCDAPDHYCGGERGYQIDHFAPKKKFPLLANVYSNLVYACPICNRAKWDDWVGDCPNTPVTGDKGYVDPCTPEYDNHLTRNGLGEIEAISPLGHYMRDKLKLALLRHQFVWQAEKLNTMRQEISQMLNDVDVLACQERQVDLLRRFREITQSYEDYKARVIG
jgi:hypothetical protein